MPWLLFYEKKGALKKKDENELPLDGNYIFYDNSSNKSYDDAINTTATTVNTISESETTDGSLKKESSKYSIKKMKKHLDESIQLSKKLLETVTNRVTVSPLKYSTFTKKIQYLEDIERDTIINVDYINASIKHNELLDLDLKIELVNDLMQVCRIQYQKVSQHIIDGPNGNLDFIKFLFLLNKYDLFKKEITNAYLLCCSILKKLESESFEKEKQAEFDPFDEDIIYDNDKPNDNPEKKEKISLEGLHRSLAYVSGEQVELDRYYQNKYSNIRVEVRRNVSADPFNDFKDFSFTEIDRILLLSMPLNSGRRKIHLAEIVSLTNYPNHYKKIDLTAKDNEKKSKMAKKKPVGLKI
jgi:hypothetical protein